jgi:PilZ domain
MRSLEYRAPRVAKDFCVDFIVDTDRYRGACIDLSEKGIRASFEEPVPLGLVGSIVMHHPLYKVSIPARAIYLLRNQVGFAFLDHNRCDPELLFHFRGTVKIR